MTSTATTSQPKPSQKRGTTGAKKQLNVNSAPSQSTASKQTTTSATPKPVTPSPAPKPKLGGWASIAASKSQTQEDPVPPPSSASTAQTLQSAEIQPSETKSTTDNTKINEKKQESKKSSKAATPETTQKPSEASAKSIYEGPSFNRVEIYKYLCQRSVQLEKRSIPYKASGSDWTTTPSKSANNKKNSRGNNQLEKERDVVAWELSKLIQRK